MSECKFGPKITVGDTDHNQLKQKVVNQRHFFFALVISLFQVNQNYRENLARRGDLVCCLHD